MRMAEGIFFPHGTSGQCSTSLTSGSNEDLMEVQTWEQFQ
jgi:hypothetical protein